LVYLYIKAKKTYVTFLLSFICGLINAQCPQFYDSNENLSSNPYWISCSGNSYALSLQSPSSFGTYTVNWGDGTVSSGNSYTSQASITHTYNSTVDTFVVVLTTGTCTVQGVVVMEKSVNASIQIPAGGQLKSCAPKILQFINSSSNVSQTTHFIWDFGDGSPPQNFNYLNAGDTIKHLYKRGTVNCQTSIQLSAYNYCTYNTLTTDNYSPITIYDKDVAQISCPVTSRCFPDNSFTPSNITVRNCLGNGNTNPRFEKWDFGNHWGTGHDSIINWQTWPPTFPVSISFPAIGSYTVMLFDSSLCGIDTASVVVNIVHKPTSLITAATNTVCQGLPITFLNSSTSSESYNWNFGNGNSWQNLPYAPETNTYNIAGNYTVSLVTFVPGSNAYCSDTNSVAIVVKPNPVSDFTFNPAYDCNSSVVTFTDLSTGIISGWNWSFGNSHTSNAITPPAQSYTAVGQYTLSLITQSTSGCKDTLYKKFVVYPAPKAKFSVKTTCTGYQTQFTDSSVFSGTDPITQYNWDFGDGSSINNSVSPIHSYTAANTYTVTLTVLTAHCSSTQTLSLLVNQTPVASYVASDYTVCPNTAISFTNTSIGALSYNWAFGDGTGSISKNPTEIYTNNTQAVINYKAGLLAISPQGCLDSISQVITVYPGPKSKFTTPYITACAPVQIKFSNTTVGGNTYYWNFGDGVTATCFDTIKKYSNTSDTAKIISVSLVSSNSYGCSDTALASYVVYPQAIYTFTPTFSGGCSPLIANFITDSGGVKYLWDFGDGSLFSGFYLQTHSFINPLTINDTFNVSLLTTNAYNCKDTSYGKVVVKPSPTAQFATSAINGCSPLSIGFTNTSTPGTTNQWYFGDSTSSTAVVPLNHTYINTDSAAIYIPLSLVVTLPANGCKDSAISVIEVYPAANYSFTVSNDTGCSIFKVPFTVSEGAFAHSYAWDFGDGTLLNGYNPTHNYSTTLASGASFTVTMMATSLYGCHNSQTSTIFVYPKPMASFVLSNNAGCAPLLTSFTNTATGNLTNTWYFGDSTTSNSALLSQTHLYQNTGSGTQSYVASLVVTGAHGCKDSASSFVSVSPQAIYKYQIIPDSGCTALPTNFSTSFGAQNYAWDFGDGQVGNGFNPNHTFINTTTNTATYSVSLIATNGYHCTDTIKHQVTVFPLPVLAFSASPLVQVYPSATVSFLNTSQTGLNYTWNLGDSTQVNTYTVPDHTYNTWGTYPIKLVINNAYCSDSLMQSISIKPPIPVAKFEGGTMGCQPLPVTFTNTSVYTTAYLWDFGDGNITNQLSPVHIYNTPGIFTVRLTAFGPGGSDTIVEQDIVQVYQKPFAYFTANPLLVYIPTNPVFLTNQSQNAVSYTWHFEDGDTSNQTSPQHTYQVSGDYSVTLIAISTNDCKDTFTIATPIKAVLASGVLIPNAFTPNHAGPSGNGVFDPTALNNFIFHPVLTGVIQYDLTIYNKWGELLFETTDQKVGWDGYYKDKLCEEDSYIYKIYAATVDSQVIQKTGSLSLFR
jgi:gliding motility-associated-like protein